MPPSSRTLTATLRWLAPTAAAACAGALVAGALEGRAMATWLGFASAAGFVAVLAVPLLAATSLVLRALWATWRPRDLALVEPDGAAPRLLGWIAAIAAGVAALAWLMFQATWQVANLTAFKPVGVSLAMPVLMVAAALALVATARPTASAIAWLARALDHRWQRRGRRTLLSPRKIAAVAGAAVVAGAVLFWHFAVRVHLGAFDVGFLAPAFAGGAAALAVHVAWHYLPPRARVVACGVAIALAAAAMACAAIVTRARPTLALAIWGERPLAGFTVDALFDPNAIRDRVAGAELRPVARAGAAHPDIVLVVLDSARADHTPPYGGDAPMPTLAHLAERGAVFEWAFAPSNLARRSLPAMLVGLGPERIHDRGVTQAALRLDPRHVLLAERLAAGGYDTAAFTCCPDALGRGAFRGGLDRGFVHVAAAGDDVGVARLARDWLDARDARGDARPLFAFIHVAAPRDWLAGQADLSFRERGPRYDRALATGDDVLTIALGAFARRDSRRAPIVIVTSDNAEPLGEHAASVRGSDLYDSQIRVPLVISGPGIATERVPETVGLVDLAATILELAGFAPPTDAAGFDSRSFADLATGVGAAGTDPATGARADDGVAFSAMLRDKYSAGSLAAIVNGKWKLIDSGGARELYDTRADPDEHANVATANPAITAQLAKQLAEHRDRAARSPFE